MIKAKIVDFFTERFYSVEFNTLDPDCMLLWYSVKSHEEFDFEQLTQDFQQVFPTLEFTVSHRSIFRSGGLSSCVHVCTGVFYEPE